MTKHDSEISMPPTPMVTPPTGTDALLAPYFSGLAVGELRVQWCATCAEYRWPPRSQCFGCLEPSLKWLPVSGRGEIFSWTVVHQTSLHKFAAETPYASGLIALDVGVRMVGQIVGCGPAGLVIGMDVAIHFGGVDEGRAPKWKVQTNSSMR